MSATDDLLRFLVKDAKLPLATAISQVKGLQQAKLTILEDIAKTDYEFIKSISTDDKTAKHVLTAAKRVALKRKRGQPEQTTSSSRKRRRASPSDLQNPADIEASLELPCSTLTDHELSEIILITNRAPLVLAFAASLLKYTMPEQPPSSRLSLAQAVTSMNAKVKAASIGLDRTKAAEDEGWGQGQPLVKVMGRDIRVMKRWGYEWKPKTTPATDHVKIEDPDQKPPAAQSHDAGAVEDPALEDSPALWALDLEQLKHLNGPLTFTDATNTTGLPIYSPDSAHSYILRAFDSVASAELGSKKKPASQINVERENNLGHLTKALDLLFQSWSETLGPAELDKRAWTWYVKVRPEVAGGASGWGQKGQVKLSDILDSRRAS